MDRTALIDEIVAETAETAYATGRSTLSPRVLAAIAKVPRERFMRPADAKCAALNIAMPIGYSQTISQPFVVALMTDLLDLAPDSKVLEIGTGSGYQAAILAELTPAVFSIEVIPELAAQARATLEGCGYRIALKLGDGNRGWPEETPFDAIIITAATPRIPPALIAQLAPGGRMVLPLGEPGEGQMLTVVEKQPDGTIATRDTLPVAFVRLVSRDPPAGA
jgi:protein-L-isoaspartate(D-aspartate) O-methyltransferase